MKNKDFFKSYEKKKSIYNYSNDERKKYLKNLNNKIKIDIDKDKLKRLNSQIESKKFHMS